MRMKGAAVLLCMVSVCAAQKWKPEKQHWDLKEHSSGRTCSNLTQVLDNWKFAIVTQMKDMLIKDHASVLPEYNRIQPLSEALQDLYRQFNTLKDELARLSTKFDSVEAFVDDFNDGRITQRQQPIQRITPRVGLSSPLQAQTRVPDRGILKGPAMIRARRRRLNRP